MFPATVSNQITEEYYYVLLGHSWSRNKVVALQNWNGTYMYYTYHRIDIL